MDDLIEVRMTLTMGRGIFALKDIETGRRVMEVD